MGKWKANKLPVIGCSMCIGDTFYRGEKCSNCKGYGYFPVKGNKSVGADRINDLITKSIQDGITT